MLKNLAFLLAVLLLSGPARGHDVADQLLPTAPGRAHLTGYLGQRIDQNIAAQVAAQDPEMLLEPFRHRTETSQWQSEFWGKWFTAAALAYQYNQDPQLRATLKKAAYGLLATQSPDGYIGNYAPGHHLEQWDVWGRKYCLLGLLAYYDISGDKKVLTAARRLADFTLGELGPGKANIVRTGNYRGMASSSILEPIVQLYTRTHEARYLAFAQYIVAQWETPDGPQLISKALADVPVAGRFPAPKSWWSWDNGQKAYEMMSCYEGLLELYRVTGEPTYRTAVARAWDNIRRTELTVVGSGASVECWFGGAERQVQPVKHLQETCVTVTWLKLTAQLLQLTGEAKYGDEVEKTGYNALLAALHPSGATWVKYCPLAGIRESGENQCGMAINCCTANGPRGLLLLPRLAVLAGPQGPVVNLYNAGNYQVAMPGGRPVSIEQQTDYPREGRVTLLVKPPAAAEFTVQLRIPAWSLATQLSVNGQPVADVRPGTLHALRRTWQPGDRIELTLDLRPRLAELGQEARYFALCRGPLVLARDASLQALAPDEVLMPTAPGVAPALTLVPDPRPGAWLEVSAPLVVGAYLEGDKSKPQPVRFVDFASAGRTWLPDSRYRVWLPQLYNFTKGTE